MGKDIKSLLSDLVNPKDNDEDNNKNDSGYEKEKSDINADMEIISPKAFEDCQRIVNVLKRGKICLIKIDNLSNDIAQRVLDYVQGATHALNGTISQVDSNVYLITPHRMVVKSDE